MMFYKDLYQNILNVILKMKGDRFKYNINNCVNDILAKFYYFEDVAFYGSQCGYLTINQYSKLSILLRSNIDTCKLKLMELYEV